jgi:hypothetical protein
MQTIYILTMLPTFKQPHLHLEQHNFIIVTTPFPPQSVWPYFGSTKAI